MLKRYNPETSKTYATKANAIKAVETAYGNHDDRNVRDLRYLVMQNDEGRWVPVFIGQECLQYGIHFHFSVVG